MQQQRCSFYRNAQSASLPHKAAQKFEKLYAEGK
jgi:hypothetical protein